jgi:putative ABC transport system substrate-binding protein
VIIAVGQKALQTAHSAAPQTPTVYCMVLGASAPSSKSVTGVRFEVAAEEQLAELKRLAPNARRIGVIYEPRISLAYLDEAQRAAEHMSLQIVSKAVNEPREVRDALNQLTGKIDALWLVPDPRLASPELIDFLLVYTLDRKIVLWGFLDNLTKAGALASLSPDYAEIGRRAGKLAQEVASRPAAQRVPVPAPVDSPGTLTINLKTAHAIGLELPASALSRARQVYR